jgi:hypothetical protein
MKNSIDNHIYFFEFLADELKSTIDPGIFSEKQRESGVGTMDLKIIKQILNYKYLYKNTYTMGKKFKITEDQLKRLVENKNKFQEEPVEATEEEMVDLPEEEEVDETQINEAIEKIKSQFKRFI